MLKAAARNKWKTGTSSICQEQAQKECTQRALKIYNLIERHGAPCIQSVN